MKKTTIAIILLLASFNNTFQSQTSAVNDPKSYTDGINKMFAAAPTTSNLMKFEEVPVSYYTGIPDISIPMISIPTINPNVAINVQLKYHPLNAKPDDRAGETGLGWSLIAGGTISRTVKGGLPDEKDASIIGSVPLRKKFGIYNEAYNPTGLLIRDEVQNVDMTRYRFYTGLGRYDTEYDLYQYNFIGQSGRFYVSKDETGALKVQKLDKNNLQINIGTDSSGIINSYTIIDDKGIKYIFEAMETSQKTNSSTKVGMTTANQYFDVGFDVSTYWTAFHLTTIKDQNNIILATFTYGLSSEVKYDESVVSTQRIAKDVNYQNTTVGNGSGNFQIPDGSMLGMFDTQKTFNDSMTRLLTGINVTGKGTITFTYEQGRQDSNYFLPSQLYKLKSVKSDFIGQNDPSKYIDKYIFDYDYSNTAFKPKWGSMETLSKMLLTKVTKVSPDPTIQNQEYDMNYSGGLGTVSKDGWGYYTGETNAVKTDVLETLTYPTKGKTKFDFGTNTYSYFAGINQGNPVEQVTGHWEPQGNIENVNFGQLSDTKKYFFTVITAQNVHLHYTLGNLINFNWKLHIYKKNADNTFTEVHTYSRGNQTCNRPQPPVCPITGLNASGEIEADINDEVSLQPGVYYASLTGSYSPSNPDDTLDYFEATTNENVYIDEKIRGGGGLRINGISYFADENSPDPAKKYIYDYRQIDDLQKSSGMLVFPVPVLNYSDVSYEYKNNELNTTIIYSAKLDISSDTNVIYSDTTQGSPVGYKYVTVKQVDKDGNSKGKTEYTFRSPIDYPNSGILSTQQPFYQIPNEDYRRGQVTSEKVYSESGQLLTETNTDYVTTEFEKNPVMKIIDNFQYNQTSQYYAYGTYEEFASHILIDVFLTTPYKGFEKFGVTLPTEKKTTDYFYKNGIQNSVVTNNSTIYNPDDYPTLITQSIQGGDTYTSSYKYAKEKNNQQLINANMIGIPLETETKKNGQTKNKVETLYSNPNLLPSSVKSTGLTGTEYTELTYEKYDSNGNLQQYKTKDGTPVSIVWGYNSTQPIAKIEGIDYTTLMQIAGSQLTAAITASDADAAAGPTGNEASLLSTLDALRTALGARENMVTTYTYDPLVGVRTITQPTGIKELYFYDSVNRLKEIKQRDANAVAGSEKTVKQFQYNYKN
ncbi:hypothetical protein SAMN05421664_2002 [Chryseobacterium soldanellicola]|uniref:YD repeat-containing protein n=1 Tax=Chryseobacterium soldanellicola TaxID=311333 RepID=A0A1H1CKD4_9FLAO|nr:hypothetical protein [Chryseobacterium soldanellicola]SDQ64634.1 hypothetical protein SAMN05421664_2002 [Chryseobacterium soldanellicola]